MSEANMKFLHAFFIVLLFISSIYPNIKDPGMNPDGTLDFELLENFYFNGDFELIINTLEEFRKQNPDADSAAKAFVYKYLGVIYSSIPQTEEKGKSYLYQLVKIAEDETLLDMYVSDRIKKIFDEIKKEYQEREKFLVRKNKKEGIGKKQGSPSELMENDSTEGLQSSHKDSLSEDSSGNQRPPKVKKSHNWIWWTAGGAVLAGSVTAFVLLSGEVEGTKRVNGGTVRPDL